MIAVEEGVVEAFLEVVPIDAVTNFPKVVQHVVGVFCWCGRFLRLGKSCDIEDIENEDRIVGDNGAARLMKPKASRTQGAVASCAATLIPIAARGRGQERVRIAPRATARVAA